MRRVAPGSVTIVGSETGGWTASLGGLKAACRASGVKAEAPAMLAGPAAETACCSPCCTSPPTGAGFGPGEAADGLACLGGAALR